MSDIENNHVTQDNALITASYSLTLNENRLLIAAISKIDPTSAAWKVGKCDIEITISEWRALFGTSSNADYNQLKQAAFKLYERSLRLWGDDQHAKHIRWLSGWEYENGKGRVVLTFSGLVLYHLSGFIDEYTDYKIMNCGSLKSEHSMRLYQLAAQFKNTGWRYIKLDDLRNLFKLGKSYSRWIDLRKRVLDRACGEITKKTNLSLHYEVIKSGRSVVAIKLRIREK